MVNSGIERKITFDQIIGQNPLVDKLSEHTSDLNDKVIVVTGGAGSIGSAVANLLIQKTNSKIWLLDQDESRVHTTSLKFNVSAAGRVNFLVTDLRDEISIISNLSQICPDIIIHAAALKHVSILERQPREGFLTNVVGSVNVINYIKQSSNCRLCFISTDKAVNPTSVLGKTKLIGEYLVAGLSTENKEAKELKIHNVVRFGNVFMSRGSVIETFIHQLKAGLPVTITNPKMERFFMDLSQAAKFICNTISLRSAGINVLEMGKPVSILKVASRIAQELGIDEFKFLEIGEKQGEKVCEELFSHAELGNVSQANFGFRSVPFSKYLNVEEIPVSADSDSDARLIIEELLNGAHPFR